MKKGLKEIKYPLGNTQTPIIPIITEENERTFVITRRLLDEGVYVNPVVAPAVKPGRCLLRTSYTATHTREQLDYALAAFQKSSVKYSNNIVTGYEQELNRKKSLQLSTVK